MVGICFSAHDLRAREYWSFIIEGFRDHIDQTWELNRPDDLDTNWKKTIPITNINELPRDIPLVVLNHKEARYLKGTIPLAKFKHPKDVIYIFGNDHRNMSNDMFTDYKIQSVYLPTRLEIYSFQVGGIVINDRITKQNG